MSSSAPPGLLPWERSNPRVYVVQRDLGELVGVDLVHRHGGELLQWSKQLELGVTACAILAVLVSFRGLRRDGAGVQAPLEAWSKALGRSRRQVAYAFAQLEAHGYARRHRRLIKHQWTDERGRVRQRCDIHGVAYASAMGAMRLAKKGRTRHLVVDAGGRERRVLHACGLLRQLLLENPAKLNVLARRVADASIHCTPSSGVTATRSLKGAAGGRAHSQAGTGTRYRPRGGASPPTAGPLGAQTGGGSLPPRRLLLRLAHQHRLLPWLLWPEIWLQGDAKARRWLWAQRDALAAELGAPPRRRDLELQPVDRPRGAGYGLDVGGRPLDFTCAVCGAVTGEKFWTVPRCRQHVPTDAELDLLELHYRAHAGASPVLPKYESTP